MAEIDLQTCRLESEKRWSELAVRMKSLEDTNEVMFQRLNKQAALMEDIQEAVPEDKIIIGGAYLHAKFENIHPFVDGNGRTGRLILNLSLMKNGYPPVNVKFADRRRYYDAFESWPGDGGGAMTRLVAEYIEEELAKLLRFAAQ